MSQKLQILINGKAVFDEEFETVDFNEKREVVPIYKKGESKPILVPSKKHKITLLCAVAEDPHSEFFTTV
jgi:hypothetical protein